MQRGRQALLIPQALPYLAALLVQAAGLVVFPRVLGQHPQAAQRGRQAPLIPQALLDLARLLVQAAGLPVVPRGLQENSEFMDQVGCAFLIADDSRYLLPLPQPVLAL